MLVANEKFGKGYKLCHEKKIQALFRSGKKIYKFPFQANYKVEKENAVPPFQIVISVPKRNFKKAHDRNRIKRLMRESIRKNKLILENFLSEQNLNMSFVLVYTHKEELHFEEIQLKIKQFFTQLINEVNHENNPV